MFLLATEDTAPITTWHMSWKKVSISSSAQKTFILKDLFGNFDFPDTDSFDIQVNVTLVRSHKKKIPIKEGFYKRYVDVNASFDYVTYGSLDTYDLTFRIVRFPISDGSFECIVTNLLSDKFPPEQIKLLYYSRWGIMPISA